MYEIGRCEEEGSIFSREASGECMIHAWEEDHGLRAANVGGEEKQKVPCRVCGVARPNRSGFCMPGRLGANLSGLRRVALDAPPSPISTTARSLHHPRSAANRVGLPPACLLYGCYVLCVVITPVGFRVLICFCGMFYYLCAVA